MTAVPNIKFNNNIEIPAFGLGTWAARGGEVEQAVKDAIDIGYRHFDTAFLYENEAEVGNAIRAKIAEGIIKREDVFVTTKVWSHFHGTAMAEESFKKSMANLNIDYIDLLLAHNPMALKYHGDNVLLPKKDDGELDLNNDVDYVDTYKGLENCFKSGKIRALGVSNYNSKQLTRLLSVCTVKPVTNQIECAPGINQKKLIKFCKDLDILVTAYCPLGRANREKKTPDYLYDPKVLAIGKKYGKTAAQVILRYLIQIDTIPIPKSVNKGRLQENIDIFDFALNDDEMQFMDTFDRNERHCPFVEWNQHTHYPFNEEF